MIAPGLKPVHHCANHGRSFLPMRNPLLRLLALVLCWQAVSAAKSATVKKTAKKTAKKAVKKASTKKTAKKTTKKKK